MRKEYIKSNIIAAIIALVILGIGAWLTSYALGDGSVWWILLAIPVLMFGVFCLGIGPMTKVIRILMVLITVAAAIMSIWGLVIFDYPWDTVSLVGGLECVFVGIFCIVMAAEAEANYERYKRALQEELNKENESV